MKVLLTLMLVAASVAAGDTQNATNKPPEIPPHKVGGTPVVIPSPAPDLVEVGADSRGLMDLFVPINNRLVAGFVLTNDMSIFTNGASSSRVLAKYALVEVPRRGEFLDCDESDFKDITAGAAQQIGTNIDSSTQEAQDEFNRRLKALNLDDQTVSIGKPIQLGCLFSKKDAYGFGMVGRVSIGSSASRYGVGCALLRVKKRMLFAYLYVEYKNKDTLKRLRKTTEHWADAILKANAK